MYGRPLDAGSIRDEDLDESTHQAERLLAAVEEVGGELERITGAGETLSGQVRATVDGQGQVLDVALGPRAMRLDRLTLAEEVLAAVGLARQDVERRTLDLLREAVPDFEPEEARARFERLLSVRWW